jgi:N-carbamoyl-L-amino-acid hydrolase
MPAKIARLLDRLDAFAAIGPTEDGGVDRQALTQGDRAARALLADLGRRRGFELTQDAIANLFVTRPGVRRGMPPLLIGSHLDTQPSGGRFDGALGVLTAFEVLEALEDDDIETEHDVVVVAWTNEEGSRFSPGAMGSRAFAEGAMAPTWLASVGRDGSAFRSAPMSSSTSSRDRFSKGQGCRSASSSAFRVSAGWRRP